MASSAESEIASAPTGDITAVGIAELEASVKRLLSAHSDMRRRAEEAEARTRALQDALRAASGEQEANAITDRLAKLEHENTILRNRVAEATVIANRIASRIQFAEQES